MLEMYHDCNRPLTLVILILAYALFELLVIRPAVKRENELKRRAKSQARIRNARRNEK